MERGFLNTMNRDTHKKLYEHYLSHGGDAKKVQLYKSFSMANHAKLKYFVKQLNVVPKVEPEHQLPKKEIIKSIKERKSIFSDLISNYPKELHVAFKDRYDYWLNACSLKIELNEVHYSDEDTAYEIQAKLWDCLEKMDRCQEVLTHYRENKRILETKSTADFSKLSAMELLKKRNSTRSNITKRKSTIKKLEELLPKHTDPAYRKRLHQINLKIEQLRKIENELKSLEEVINNVL